MIAALDVHYRQDQMAAAAAVLFRDWADGAPFATYESILEKVAAYRSGQFYKRELPCLLALLKSIHEPLETLIVDGYVTHGDGPDLGWRLFSTFKGRIAVIGVAKSKYANAQGIEILRGDSRRPLYVSAAGMDIRQAACHIRQMQGRHRIPTLLKLVDQLARAAARGITRTSGGMD